jgi:hypothetical protein
LDILLFVVIAVGAARAARTLRGHKALFDEFGVSKAAVPLLLLFPLGPLVLLVMSREIGLIPGAVIAVACFVPGLVTINRARDRFERSGTDRTKPVHDALGVGFIVGIGGLAYVIAATLLAFVVSRIHNA